MNLQSSEKFHRKMNYLDKIILQFFSTLMIFESLRVNSDDPFTPPPTLSTLTMFVSVPICFNSIFRPARYSLYSCHKIRPVQEVWRATERRRRRRRRTQSCLRQSIVYWCLSKFENETMGVSKSEGGLRCLTRPPVIISALLLSENLITRNYEALSCSLISDLTQKKRSK